MGGSELQNSFLCGRNSHHGIATIVTIRALPEALIYNVCDLVRTKKSAHDTAHFGRCTKTVDILFRRPPNIYSDRETICISPTSTQGGAGRRG